MWKYSHCGVSGVGYASIYSFLITENVYCFCFNFYLKEFRSILLNGVTAFLSICSNNLIKHTLESKRIYTNLKTNEYLYKWFGVA